MLRLATQRSPRPSDGGCLPGQLAGELILRRPPWIRLIVRRLGLVNQRRVWWVAGHGACEGRACCAQHRVGPVLQRTRGYKRCTGLPAPDFAKMRFNKSRLATGDKTLLLG